MKKYVIAGVLLLGLANSVYADGQPVGVYIGGMIGDVSYNYADVKNSTPKELYIGYRKSDSAFGVELSSVELGDAKVQSLPGVSFDAHGYNISGVYHSSNSKVKLGYYLRAGYYSFKTDLKLNGATLSTASGSGLSLAGGLDYAVNQYISVRAELQDFINVKDYANNTSVFGGLVGVEVHF